MNCGSGYRIFLIYEATSRGDVLKGLCNFRVKAPQ